MNFCPECGIECDGLPIAYSNGELILLGNHNVDGVECLKRQVIQKAYQLAAKSAECEKLKQTIETMKANEREKYASAAKALGVVAPCDRATLLNEKGE